MTTRGATEADFAKIAEFIHRTIQFTKKSVDSNGFKTLKDFTSFLDREASNPELTKLRLEIESFASRLDTVGNKPV
jgi:glycine hydroxymethyltransferase